MVAPDARKSRSKETQIRVPRTHGLPKQIWGSTAILLGISLITRWPLAPQDISVKGHRPAYISRRPSMAFDMVTSSANSRSLPTGTPMAMRITFTPSGLSRRAR